MKKQIDIPSLEHIGDAAREFLQLIEPHRIIAFYGAMGAGKTTFIKAICEELGTSDVVNSPTFSIVNEYDYDEGAKIFHFDFYRIKHAEEAFDFGIEEYWSSQELCLMEWPELVEPILPDNTLRVTIVENSDHSRTITIE